MAAIKRKIGHIKCLCCGTVLSVKENERGALDVSCRDCDLSAWAKSGTEAATKIRAAMTPIAGELPALPPAPPQAKPGPKPVAPAPAPAVVKRNVWGIPE